MPFDSGMGSFRPQCQQKGWQPWNNIWEKCAMGQKQVVVAAIHRNCAIIGMGFYLSLTSETLVIWVKSWNFQVARQVRSERYIEGGAVASTYIQSWCRGFPNHKTNKRIIIPLNTHSGTTILYCYLFITSDYAFRNHAFGLLKCLCKE